MKHLVKTVRVILLSSIFLIIATLATAQNTTDSGKTLPSEQSVKKEKAKVGTYQIYGLDAKIKHAFTDETFIYIEEQRKEHENVTIALNYGAAVFITSKDEILSPDFKPLKEFLEE